MPAYILTGAPGAGKTAVLRHLETDGYAVVEEAATGVVALEDSLVFERIHEQAYRDFGFRLVDVPAGPLADRVAVIKRAIGR